MNRLATLAIVLASATLFGCQTTETSPGAVSGEKSGCCAAEKSCETTCPAANTSMGAVNGESCATKSSCSSTCTKTNANMGAVSGEGCCAKKAGCTKTDASMGAVSGEGCASKSACTKDATNGTVIGNGGNASMGAVSGSSCAEKAASGCCASKK